MEEVKEHPYVIQCDAAKPLIVDTFKFMYDLDFLNPQAEEVRLTAFFCSLSTSNLPEPKPSPNQNLLRPKPPSSDFLVS